MYLVSIVVIGHFQYQRYHLLSRKYLFYSCKFLQCFLRVSCKFVQCFLQVLAVFLASSCSVSCKFLQCFLQVRAVQRFLTIFLQEFLQDVILQESSYLASSCTNHASLSFMKLANFARNVQENGHISCISCKNARVSCDLARISARLCQIRASHACKISTKNMHVSCKFCKIV